MTDNVEEEEKWVKPRNNEKKTGLQWLNDEVALRHVNLKV